MKVSLNRYDTTESSRIDRHVHFFSLLSKILMIAAISILVFLITSSSFTTIPEITEQENKDLLLSSTAPPVPF